MNEQQLNNFGCPPINQINNNQNNVKNKTLVTIGNEQNNNNNINNNELNNIEIFNYNERYAHDVIDNDRCLICSSKFNQNDVIRKLECGHIYHKLCLEIFCQSQKNENFPICLICLQWELQDNINKQK